MRKLTDLRLGAIDIGGTKIAVGVTDGTGRLLSERQTPTHPHAGFDEACTRISSLLLECVAQAGLELNSLGIACTGPVDPQSGTIGHVEFLPGWSGKNLVAAFTSRFNVPCALENDADAAALAEAAVDPNSTHRSVICVTIGTGIGAGVVREGRLVRGVSGSHPEIGHMTLSAEYGPKCYCGATGCWESLASGTALATWASQNAPRDYPDRENLTAAQIFDRARQSDPFALIAVAREARYLGLGVANLVTVFAPDQIVLGGSIMQGAEFLMPSIRATVSALCTQVPSSLTQIETARLGQAAPLVGAAKVGYQKREALDRSCFTQSRPMPPIHGVLDAH